MKIKVPEDMAFNAYLEIKEQNSENTPEGCAPPPIISGDANKLREVFVELIVNAVGSGV